jgi:hypothetical protein
MTTNQPAILSALERVIDRAKHAPRVFTSNAITETPLIEREGNYFCSAYIYDYSEVNPNPVYDETVTKVRCDTFKVVYWADHPLGEILESAIEDGELSEEDAEADCPQSYIDMAEDHLSDFILDEIYERLDIDAEVISKESQSYCPMGGWSVIVKSKDLYSVDCQLSAKARVVAA